jgi:ribonuclease PH
MSFVRSDGRDASVIRPVKITPGFTRHAEGSVLIEVGDTRVICTASIEDRAPMFRKGTGLGWVTAEYSMLPRATEERTARESTRGKVSGRTQEIQRLIGRSLRAVVDHKKMGERTITIDCDVIQADGGTRTASITGGFVALVLAMRRLVNGKYIDTLPISDYVAAISIGILNNQILLDLKYDEDSKAGVDMNIVRTGAGQFIEVQGTAEGALFSLEQMNEMITIAGRGIDQLIAAQKEILGQLR